MSYRREERQSHYRSPRRQHLNSQLEEHSNKIKELLRHDLNMLEQENALLKAKCKKVTDLEDKTETLLRQNSELLAQNEKISKLLHQKKSEYEILKNKYEANMAHRHGATAQFQFEKKKLVNEIDILQAELRQAQAVKNNQINQIKSQYQLQIQSMKRQNSSSHQVYEQQIRKLRQLLDKRDYENSESMNKLKRLSSESEYQILRLKQQKQKLRNQLAYLENQRKKDLDNLKSKLQVNYLQEIDTLKRNHYTNLDGIQTENIRLKEYLDARGREVDDLNTKINKQKAHFEETIVLLRKQNENVRLKMLEGQRYSEHEIENLKSKLSEMHQAEIDQLKINHQKYIECLQGQINKMEGYLRNKNQQIQQLIKEKTSVRQMFQAQTGRLKQEIEALQLRIRDLQNEATNVEAKYEDKIAQKQNHIKYLDDLNKDQRDANDKQQNALRQIIEHQKSQLDQERMSNKQKQQALKESVAEYKAENGSLKDDLRREKADKQRQLDDLRNQLEGNITQLQTKVQTLTSQTNISNRENQSHRRAIQIKDKEIRSLQERVRGSDQRQKKLEKQIEDLRMKLIKKDQKTNEMLAQQKERLENSFNYTLQNLKNDNEGALKLEQNKIADANDKLRKKEKELDQLLRSYKKMRDQVEGLTQQQANKKQMTLKYPGATADLIATKNLFDVYLKTRVLDICGDAAEKENR